jgi:hypothetical protein
MMQCIKTIHENRKSPLQRYIEARAVEDDNMSKGDCWSTLRHATGRLMSYKYAVQTLVHAHRIWADTDLFREFDVESLASSSPYPTQALKFMPETAEIVIGRTPGCSPSQIQVYKTQAADFELYGLNDKLEQRLEQKLEPVVHAEMLLHDWLSRTEGGTQPYRFFKNWRYIGTSKPICRLCQHYFDAIATPVRFRSGHPNTYLNWRLPDIYVDKDDEKSIERARKTWYEVLNEMKKRVYTAVARVLEEKVPDKKPHDSNTYTERITAVADPIRLGDWIKRLHLK